MPKHELPRFAEQFAAEIRSEISRYLRQGRSARKLSIAQAAKAIDISAFHLKSIEEGTVPQSLNIVYAALEYYGINNYELMDLVNELTLAKRLRIHQTRKRKNFSVVGDNPKLWENPPESLSDERKRGSMACKW